MEFMIDLIMIKYYIKFGAIKKPVKNLIIFMNYAQKLQTL